MMTAAISINLERRRQEHEGTSNRRRLEKQRRWRLYGRAAKLSTPDSQ
jgi:hypothetical protein